MIDNTQRTKQKKAISYMWKTRYMQKETIMINILSQ